MQRGPWLVSGREVTLPPGTAPRDRTRLLRVARPDDAAAIRAMFDRCSDATRYQRFLSPVPRFPERHLTAVVHPRSDRPSWVVVDERRARVVAVGSVFRTGRRTAELGLLVEDAEQRQGLGTELLRVMVASARRGGVTELDALALLPSLHLRRMLGRLGPVTVVPGGDVCDLHLDLTAA
jgi:RimJ/RimL family protein N-acetyltransferase